MMRRLLILSVVLSASVAWADAEEASFHLEAAPAMHRMEDVQGAGATSSVAAMRLSARFTYGWKDWLALEGDAGAILGNDAEFAGQSATSPTGGTQMGTLRQDERGVRGLVGLTGRFGVRFIPTVTLAVGFQQLWITNVALLDSQGRVKVPIASGSASDLLAVGGVGLDYRISAHWLAGVSVQAVYGVPLSGGSFVGVEIPFHLAYYWYPRWKSYSSSGPLYRTPSGF